MRGELQKMVPNGKIVFNSFMPIQYIVFSPDCQVVLFCSQFMFALHYFVVLQITQSELTSPTSTLQDKLQVERKNILVLHCCRSNKPITV